MTEGLTRNDVEEIRRTQIQFCADYTLYQHTRNGFMPYKKEGIKIPQERVERGGLPEQLFIKKSDAIKVLQAAQEGFNKQLKEGFATKDPAKIKASFNAVTAETLAQPRGATLDNFSRTIDILIESFLKDPNVMLNLVNMAAADRYDTTFHCSNACILVLAYCIQNNLHRNTSVVTSIGKSALLHDIGKTNEGFPQEIIQSESRLTNTQYEVMMSHTREGIEIIMKNGITDGDITDVVWHHHERINGEGYPQGLSGTSVTIPVRIVSLVNSYDRMTSGGIIVPREGGGYFRRVYAKREALERIAKRDVASGAFDKDIYEGFLHIIRK